MVVSLTSATTVVLVGRALALVALRFVVILPTTATISTTIRFVALRLSLRLKGVGVYIVGLRRFRTQAYLFSECPGDDSVKSLCSYVALHNRRLQIVPTIAQARYEQRYPDIIRELLIERVQAQFVCLYLVHILFQGLTVFPLNSVDRNNLSIDSLDPSLLIGLLKLCHRPRRALLSRNQSLGRSVA